MNSWRNQGPLKGLVGRLINNNNWNSNIYVEQLNTCIDEKIKELETQRIDT